MNLPWIEPGDPLPDPAQAVEGGNLMHGLVAAGRDLSAERLLEAYSQGIFPWYTEPPVLWWSPDPRMVLYLDDFRLRRSLQKTVRRTRRESQFQVTINHAFAQVINACAQSRPGQDGTWITTEMIDTYCDLHDMGYCQSVEVWDPTSGNLVGGLYGVSMGRMFFGESMFTRVTDASKIALVCLTHHLKSMDFAMIDCQQTTGHLASFGAKETSRNKFLSEMAPLVRRPSPKWPAMQIEIPPA